MFFGPLTKTKIFSNVLEKIKNPSSYLIFLKNLPNDNDDYISVGASLRNLKNNL